MELCIAATMAAFQERCPGIQVVFDCFHIVRSFNEKVVGEMRKAEQARLEKEGDAEAARRLKKAKHIITSGRDTLEKKDGLAGTVPQPGGGVFRSPEVLRKGGRMERLKEILTANTLLCTADIVRQELDPACQARSRNDMKTHIDTVLELCDGTGDRHFAWLAKLVRDHIDGILSHADHPCSSGRVEVMVNMIKTIRRQAFGLPASDCSFLKIIDASWRRSAARRKPRKNARLKSESFVDPTRA